METKHIYEIRAKSTRVRSGVVASDEIPSPIVFSAPPEFEGEPHVWTPEHFFIASVVTCYVSTFSGMSDLSRFPFVSLEVEANGVIEKDTNGWKFTEIRLHPTLKVAHEEDRERGMRLLEKAERNCLIARSIAARISLAASIKVTPQLAETVEGLA
jgi:peroxiredoxin-like protein